MTGNAAIYSHDVAPRPEVLEKLPLVRRVSCALSTDGVPERYLLGLDSTQVTINVMPRPEVASHLSGFSEYVQHLNQVTPSANTPALLAQINGVRTVLGILVEPDWDAQEQAAETVWAIAEEMGGLVFAADSVFACSGEPLVGPAAQAEA